ncbi:ATP-binding protein [Kitasatospora sp. NPDC058965]|uniref:ATP-binding protein n=1 Tax=Kitasatospora sp. NPDC058965 TaxID=3346682 RepID=UPI0036954687
MVTQPPAAPFATTVRLPRSARSVGKARAAFRADAAAWGLPVDETDTAALLLSELLTNACRHAHAPRDRYLEAGWALDRPAGVLRVAVSDASRTLPKPRQAAPDDESGRGLELLTALATAWGAAPREGGIGKTVWCELKVPVERA